MFCKPRAKTKSSVCYEIRTNVGWVTSHGENAEVGG
jgi:hypothetical protein